MCALRSFFSFLIPVRKIVTVRTKSLRRKSQVSSVTAGSKALKFGVKITFLTMTNQATFSKCIFHLEI